MLLATLDAFRLAAPIEPVLRPGEGIIAQDLFRGLLFQGPHVHRDVRVGVILSMDDGGVVSIVRADSLTERKPKVKKRERRPTGMATGNKATKQAKKAEQRRMKLQYKTDRKSNASRCLPARFVRR